MIHGHSKGNRNPKIVIIVVSDVTELFSFIPRAVVSLEYSEVLIHFQGRGSRQACDRKLASKSKFHVFIFIIFTFRKVHNVSMWTQ